MHELSIALSMIEGIEDMLEDEPLRSRTQALAVPQPIQAVHVRIGVLSGVDPEALRSAYSLASEGTALAGTRLQIETVPLLVYCPQCASTHSPPAHEVFCPRCITPAQNVLAGRELEVAALELAA